MRPLLSALLLATAATTIAAQAVPQPFPRPGQAPSAPQTPGSPVASPPAAPAPTAAMATPQDPQAPPGGSLGVTIYPTAQFITSYDAGKGQRYYLYGTTSSFTEIVQYYRTLLRQRGDLVFEQPPVHQFDLGRFREETMAFPPSVTIKDYTWGGKGGYLNPQRGAQPERFATIIQIVPVPPAVPR